MNDMIPTSISDHATEAFFGSDELFYSRTDQRGVIRTGNAVFQRVSGYDWSQMAGAPHRIVRHPDMPRAVFHLLWKSLLAGESIVAYVKNRVANGNYYWVLATVLPIADGFLSIRIKPTSPLLARVERIYADIRAVELAEKPSPEVSADALIQRLQALGYADYRTFMRAALREEFASRNAVHPRLNSMILADMEKVEAALDAITKMQDLLQHEFERLRDLPTNMRIIAARMEPSGGPVSAISETYKVALSQLSGKIDSITECDASLLNQMKSSFAKAQLQMFYSILQAEVIEQFLTEDNTSKQFDTQLEEDVLADLARINDLNARSMLADSVQIAAALKSSCSDIRRSMLGLDTIRVMGRVESERIGVGGTRLEATINQLDVRHAVIIERLQSIMDGSATVSAAIGRISSSYSLLVDRVAAQ